MPQSLVFSSISLFNCHTQRLTQRLPLTSLNLRCMSSNTSTAPSTNTHTHRHTPSQSCALQLLRMIFNHVLLLQRILHRHHLYMPNNKPVGRGSLKMAT